MKKLEDISKENIFRVPDGYFDKLPGLIQARVARPEPVSWFVPAFKFSIPVVAIAIALTIWFTSGQGISLEDQLNEIQTEQLLVYLNESDMPVDLLNEEISWSEDDLYELEETVLSSIDPLDISIDEFSLEPDNY